jgi:hypothetical protein
MRGTTMSMYSSVDVHDARIIGMLVDSMLVYGYMIILEYSEYMIKSILEYSEYMVRV